MFVSKPIVCVSTKEALVDDKVVNIIGDISLVYSKVIFTTMPEFESTLALVIILSLFGFR